MVDMSSAAPPVVDLVETCEWVANESLLFADAGSPFSASVAPGDPRLVVIAGENASGKSLFFRVLAQRVSTAGPTAVTISIRERVGAGGDMSGLRRVFMFGDEAEQSTGATSVKAIAAAFRSNLDREGGSVLGLDEPELGLSDGYSRALGEFIGSESTSLPAACSGVVVVTHHRDLVRAMVDAFGATPTFVLCGDGPADLDRWLGDVEERSVEDLLALADVGLERWRAVHRLLKP
jgi:hypothetical protein